MRGVETIDLGDVDFDNIEVKARLAEEMARRITRSDASVDDALPSFRMASDAHQLAVIRDSNRTLRVVAPAGAGKTQTLVNRLIQVVKDGTRPDRVLLLTFDNAAASAIHTKLLESLNGSSLGTRSFKVMTLNAFGYGLLRQYATDDYRRVVEPKHALSLIKGVKKELERKSPDRFVLLPPNLKNRFYLDFFGFLKNNLFDPRNLRAQDLADFLLQARPAGVFFLPGQSQESIRLVVQAVIWLFRQYEGALQAAARLDFDDQKLRAWAHLAKNSRLAEVVASRYDEVVVDEFQDINKLDFELIRLVAANARLLVAGDDDQAIYGFRGCTPEYIINLDKHIGRPVVSHELRINYRCPPNVVGHAAQLIRHNRWRIEKQPVANRKDLASIKVVSAGSAYVEARSIVSFIKKVKSANRTLGYQDFCVLYRTNAQSLPLQVEFILNDIPYYVRKEDNILSNELLERLLCVLRVKAALRRAQEPGLKDAVECIKAYFRYLAPASETRLERLFRSNGTFLDTLRSAGLTRVDPKFAQSNLVSHVQEAMRIAKLTDTLTYIGQNFKGMQGMIGSLEEVIEGGVPLGEIFELAAAFRGNLDEFIQRLSGALERARMNGAGEDRDHGVSLLTYFRAKGLQWHTVILTSCNAGLIPHRNAPLEDERRLFYVALTRASSNLMVSYLKKTCGSKVAISPFLVEARLLT